MQYSPRLPLFSPTKNTSAMLSMKPMHPASRYSPCGVLPRTGHHYAFSEPNNSPWSICASPWTTIDPHRRGSELLDLPCATKPRTAPYATWDSLVGLNSHGDEILDPTELPHRQLSPIGSWRRAPCTSMSHARSPTPPPTATPPICANVARSHYGSRGREAAHTRTSPRSSSAPPDLQRRPLEPLQEAQVVDETVGATIPARTPPLRHPPPLTEKAEPHKSDGCKGDPLCATHRKRPVRTAGPHCRSPTALKDKRPKFGQRHCDDFECISGSCEDCAYLKSRGGMLWTKIAREYLEDDLDSIGLESKYAEDTLALLRFRATFQMRRAFV